MQPVRLKWEMSLGVPGEACSGALEENDKTSRRARENKRYTTYSTTDSDVKHIQDSQKSAVKNKQFN